MSLCRPVCVTLVFSSKGQRYLRVGLAVPLFGSLACLRRMVADEGNLSPDQVTGAHSITQTDLMPANISPDQTTFPPPLLQWLSGGNTLGLSNIPWHWKIIYIYMVFAWYSNTNTKKTMVLVCDLDTSMLYKMIIYL